MIKEIEAKRTWVFGNNGDLTATLDRVVDRPTLQSVPPERIRRGTIALPEGVDTTWFLFEQMGVDPLWLVTNESDVNPAGQHRYGYVYFNAADRTLTYVTPMGPPEDEWAVLDFRCGGLGSFVIPKAKYNYGNPVPLNIERGLSDPADGETLWDVYLDVKECIETFWETPKIPSINANMALVKSVDWPLTVDRWLQFGLSLSEDQPRTETTAQVPLMCTNLKLASVFDVPADLRGKLIFVPDLIIHDLVIAGAGDDSRVGIFDLNKELLPVVAKGSQTKNWEPLKAVLDSVIATLREVFFNPKATPENTFVSCGYAIIQEGTPPNGSPIDVMFESLS